MSNLTISIFENQIFLEIINRLNLFSKYKIVFYDNLALFTQNKVNEDQLIIFFITKENEKDCVELIKKNIPLIIINKSLGSNNQISGEFVDQLTMPFSVLYLEKKMISLLAKYKFKQNSLIDLHGYTINKHERKIKKNNLELQLTEREINFLILFSRNNKPVSRNFILKNVWNYSSSTDTHTVETHIHRLRKKFLEKFEDSNFIKNNDKGYYI